MPQNDSSKTEQATPQRIRDARKDGNVLMSQEVAAVVVVLVGVLLLILTARNTAEAFGNTLTDLCRQDCRETWQAGELNRGLRAGLVLLARMLLPPLLLLALAQVASVFAQVGPYLEAAPLRWRLDQLNPVNGLKRLAPNLENILKLLMALIKISAIAALTYLAIRRDLGQLVTLPLISPLAGFMWVSGRCLVLALKVLVLFVGVAAIDYAYRRHEYYEKLKMTKQEVRDEHRNQEGDPMVKGRRRRRMRELTLARLMTEVPQADVVVVNPTHVAVALRYAPGMPAPRVVAKGLRKRALRIRRIAEGAGVPVVHEPPLARALYRQTRTGGYIPSDFFRAVALVLAQLQRTGTRSFTS